jgi:thiosulfate dehydrogenase (quinone) large subunit
MNTQLTTATPVEATALVLWRLKGMGILRIVFGLIWAIDAWFKWQPDFIHNFVSYLTGTFDG